ncbi:hypothetical protein C7B76_06120 [filamentous cyanobacterium CCP2]|nr:hypothetical protein C7B76_06120 [filamentous cyanobacterium CCP2]
MDNSAVIKNYLDRLLQKYQQWWKLYWLIDQEYERFDFGVEVQTEEEIQEDIPTQRGSEKKTISVLDGIDLYARKEPVLLVGQPGSGKSTALVRFLLKAVEQALQDPQAPIPIFIELRRCTLQSGGISTLIQETLERLGLEGADIKKLRFGNRPFLLLLDGLNELPSGQAFTKLNNFREDCADLGIPIVVTTRVLNAGSLGIERKLEIKPLSPLEIQRFFHICLPFESKQRLQKLSDRLRELGRTPLMLWMLYVVLKEPQGEIPNSRGELFRRFVWIYERKREKIYLDEDSKLDDETRRWWTRLLKPLAYEMMRSGKSGEPTDFRLVISKQDAETICKDFLKAEEVNNYSDLAIRCLDALIRHHLIQIDPEKQEIEFCHQLLQEYYAAEYLLEKLPELLKNEQGMWKLQHDYLNYLKWTEPIGLMMGLPDLAKQNLVKLIDSALKVDLLLGIQLLKLARSEDNPEIIQISLDHKIPCKLKTKLETIRSSNISSTVKRQIRSFDKGIIDKLDKNEYEHKINDALRALEEGRNHFINSMDINVFLSAVADPKLLPKLSNLLLVETADVESVIRITSATQTQCQFYNYTIATQSPPPPPGQQTSLKERYEDILDTIYHTGREIERKPQTYQNMGEEALRDIFLVALNGKYRGCATGETFNKNGKTDILLRDDGRNLFIAECKIWGGAELLRKTLDQLLGYATWRDTQLAMLIFNRNKNFSAVLKQIPDVIRKCPHVAERVPDESYDETGFRFILHHPDDSERKLLLTILAFDVP